MPESSRKASLMALAATMGLFSLAVGAVLYLFNPAQSSFYPFCLFHRMTGLLCPGCGSLRAMHQLLHGHVLAALHCNALLVVAFPLAGAWLIYRKICRIKRAPVAHVQPAWIWAGLVVLLAFALVRNLPFRQLTILSP